MRPRRGHDMARWGREAWHVMARGRRTTACGAAVPASEVERARLVLPARGRRRICPACWSILAAVQL